jgi:hypothetical protein
LIEISVPACCGNYKIAEGQFEWTIPAFLSLYLQKDLSGGTGGLGLIISSKDVYFHFPYIVIKWIGLFEYFFVER